MTALQKAQHPEFYTQLKLQLLDPGDTYVGFRRQYTPVNRDDWTWEDAMSAPDTPYIARALATRKIGMLCVIGVH